MNNIELDEFKSIVNTFFSKMNIETDSLEISKEAENIYYIKVKSNDSSLIIGHSGKNLEDIRTILKGIFVKKLGGNIILHLEVNDYLSKKDDKLFDYISKKIELVKKGKEVILPFYNAYERKKIHSFINGLNDSSIFTKSIGEGNERRLHICKKSENITIDIDGIDI